MKYALKKCEKIPESKLIKLSAPACDHKKACERTDGACLEKRREMMEECAHLRNREKNPPEDGYYFFTCDEFRAIRDKEETCSMSGQLSIDCIQAFDNTAKACGPDLP